MFTVRHEILLNIFPIEADFWRELAATARSTFFGCAFTGAVRAGISENTSWS